MQLDLISWNILNHQSGNIRILLKNTDLTKNHIKQLIKNEKSRYNLVVKNNLFGILDYLYNQSKIIFLQEVDKEILVILKKKYKLVFSTREPDINLLTNEKKQEYRVIILPETFLGFEIIEKEIILENSYAKKNCLMVKINMDSNYLILINVHLHWKSNDSDIKKYAEKIFGELKKSFIDLTKLRIIISGDFNKSIKKVENNFGEIFKLLSNNGIILNSNYQNISKDEFTSHTTDTTETKKFDIIDNILTSSNITVLKPIQIIDKINGMDAYMSPNDLINLNLPEIKLNPGYISDHKLIQLSIRL
jgi:hypothetical protein